MRQILILSFLAVLGGCSSVSSLWSDSKPDDEVVPVQAATTQPPAPAAPARDDSFCRNVAQNDASESSFDEATQKRVAAQSYAQCRFIYGDATASH